MANNCEDSEYSEFIQNHMNVESTTDNLNRLAEEDGTPDEAKEWEDLEGEELPPEEPNIPNDEQEAHDYFMKKHGNKKLWYRKYGLSNNEEDNLVMDEIEGERYHD